MVRALERLYRRVGESFWRSDFAGKSSMMGHLGFSTRLRAWRSGRRACTGLLMRYRCLWVVCSCAFSVVR